LNIFRFHYSDLNCFVTLINNENVGLAVRQMSLAAAVATGLIAISIDD